MSGTARESIIWGSRSSIVYGSTCIGHADRPVLGKFAGFPWQLPFFEAETIVYEWIDGQGIGPKFLGHLTEAGRANGFVVEYIDGARSAGVESRWCEDVLAKLHSLGIKHGDINKHNFLVRGGKAVLVDFETAQRCSEEKDLEVEYGRSRH